VGGVWTELNRADAIRKVIEIAEQGDIVLIAGKGHETYQEVSGVRFDFDDASVARLALLERNA
jgi:UDP-N-acetylmuramoyl-L-alanyl-D-glutamate--2,6-diaminopimelate ligase